MSLLRVIQTALGRKGLGYRQDPPDARDFRIEAHLGALASSPPPPSASVKNPSVGPKDQGATISCAGQSTSQAVRLAYLRAGYQCPDLSALYAYYLGRSYEGEEHNDDGAVIRDVIKALQAFGEADESHWPFKPSKVNKQPSVGAYRDGYKRKGVRGYHRISQGDVDSVRRAIAAGYPVVGGWSLSQSFLDWDGVKVITAQQAPFVGGHAMPIVAYGADGTFELLNSWGSSWGRGGYAMVDESFVAKGTDLWAVQVG